MLLLSHKKPTLAFHLYRERERGLLVSCGCLAGRSRTKLLKASLTRRGEKVLGTQCGLGVPGAIVGRPEVLSAMKQTSQL